LGEKIYREYKKPDEKEKNSNNNKMGFWFVDLIPITE